MGGTASPVMILVCLALTTATFSNLQGQPLGCDRGWADDPTFSALTTEGLEDLLPVASEHLGAGDFGTLLGVWTWQELGIPGDNAGAGLTIDYPYLYLANQDYHRVYILDISSGAPDSLIGWFCPPGSLVTWSTGMDNDQELWIGDVEERPCRSCLYEMTNYPPFPCPTGKSFTLPQGSWWIADISENYPHDTLFAVIVEMAAYKSPIYAIIESGEHEVRSQGYWRRQCKDESTENVCACVDSILVLTTLFSGFDCDSICSLMRIDPPERDPCRKAKRQFMALLLNVTSGKLGVSDSLVDGRYVTDVISEIDSVLSGSPQPSDCMYCLSLADSLNNGTGIARNWLGRSIEHPAWSGYSQRALTYNNDNGTFLIGGWYSNRIWEVSVDDGAPLPGRTFLCPDVSGIAYQDIAHGGPVLWAQTNQVIDELRKYDLTPSGERNISCSGSRAGPPTFFVTGPGLSVDGTSVRFEIPNPMVVSLRVYDKTGRLVRTLVDGEQKEGMHQIEWDGLDGSGQEVPQGIYFSRLQVGTSVSSGKLILLH
jgi:hypothetical protein